MDNDILSLIDPGNTLLIIIATIVTAAGLAMAATFVIPSLIDRLLPSPLQEALWNFMHFEKVMSDRKTVRCKGNLWFRTIYLKGADITLSSNDSRMQYYIARKKFIDELEPFGITHVKFFHMKEKISLTRSLSPQQNISKEIDKKWEESFPNAYDLKHYVVLCVKGKNFDDASDLLDRVETFTLSTLQPYKPTVLIEPVGEVSLKKDHEDSRCDGPLGPLARAISPITRPNPMGLRWRGPLSALLVADDIDFNEIRKGNITFRHGDKKKLSCIIGWRDCGEKTTEAVVRDLLSIDAEMIIYHAIEPISQAMAILGLNREKRSSAAMHLSMNAADQYADVLLQVEGTRSDDKASLSYYSMHVMPFADNERDLKRIENQINAIMSRGTGTVIKMNETAQPVLMSTVSNDQTWPRRFRFLSTNIAASIYPQSSMAGLMRSDWISEPIAWFRTVSGDPYPFQFHGEERDQAAAHCLIIGPTGSGKTSLLSFLALQAMRVPDIRVFLFDRLNGMKVCTTCADGRYINFNGDSSSTALNPLHLPDSPENRAFLRQWLQLITKTSDPESQQEIGTFIQLLYDSNQPLENRSLAQLYKAAFSSTGLIRKNIQPWVTTEGYGNLFNAKKDTLNINSNVLTAFDMTMILNDETLAPAVISYIVHQIRMISMQKATPTLMMIDESAPMLASEDFKKMLTVGLQEGRKLRQSYTLCFQTPQSMFNTGLKQVIQDQCQTQIFLRNRTDSEEIAQEYEKFGLTKSEIDFIVGKTYSEHKYAVLIKKAVSNDSAIVNVDLSRLENLMQVFESDARQVARINQLIEKYPHDEAVKRFLEKQTN